VAKRAKWTAMRPSSTTEETPSFQERQNLIYNMAVVDHKRVRHRKRNMI
jgi:hypothetical protein